MTVSVYRVGFNSNHPRVAMKTVVWIHEDVLDHFKGHLKAYAAKRGFVNYTDQQMFVDLYLQAYRAMLEKYELRGLTDYHILSLKDEYNELLLKNDLLEKFEFFVVPKHLNVVFQQPKVNMVQALNILSQLKGQNNTMTDWSGYHKRERSKTLRMSFNSRRLK